MKLAFVVLLILSFTPICNAQDTTKVLFVGNSLTYYNDMPQTLQKMINEKGLKIRTDQITFPGMPLAGHYINIDSVKKISPTTEKILSQKWDFVVLQEGTVFLLVPEERTYYVGSIIAKFDSLIKVRKGKTILFQNFALSEYPKQYCYPGSTVFIMMKMIEGFVYPLLDVTKDNYCSDTFRNSTQEFEAIKGYIENTANKIQAQIAPVGYAYEICKQQYPEIDLYAEENHPSKTGSYLIACVFFRTLTKGKIIDAQYANSVSESDAKKIRMVVNSIEMN